MWKPVPPEMLLWPLLEASDTGQIRNIRTGTTYTQWSCDGYMRVRLSVAGSKRNHAVHRLVCAAFHGAPPPGKPQVNHKDFDRANNAPGNLEWVSARENFEHAIERQTRPGTKGRAVVGMLTPEDQIYFPSIAQARKAGYDGKGIRESIKKGWKHRSRRWRYVDGPF